MNKNVVITGLGVVAPNGIGKDAFWDGLKEGRSAFGEVSSFDTADFSLNYAAEIKNFDAKDFLAKEGLRNLDRSALFLMVAAKFALEDAKLKIDEKNTDEIGVCTGTTFSHLWATFEFDKEVFKESLDFASPVLFPSTVLNATSSHVSIYFNIQGFNATITTGYTSSLDAFKYAISALETGKVNYVLVGCVDALSYYLFGGFYRLGYMAGIKGEPVSCPFDKRRNGPLLGEGAVAFLIEYEENARKRGADILARVRSVESFFDAFRIGKIHPHGEGFEKAAKRAIEDAGIDLSDIDYISSCANSSADLDRIEVKVLKRIFGSRLKKIPVSSIKSMLGETISSAGGLQIASVIGAMQRKSVPPTINYKTEDPECDIDCVPNVAQKKDVKLALVDSFGPGAFNSACILERYAG